jgi:6-phosphofructokinase
MMRPYITRVPAFARGIARRAVKARTREKGLGAAATEHLAKGEHGVLVGLLRGEIETTSLAEAVANKKPMNDTDRHFKPRPQQLR